VPTSLRTQASRDECDVYYLISGIAVAQAILHIVAISSVFCLSFVVCPLSHSCTLLKPFYGFIWHYMAQIHLWGLMRYSDPWLLRKTENFGVKPPPKPAFAYI